MLATTPGECRPHEKHTAARSAAQPFKNGLLALATPQRCTGCASRVALCHTPRGRAVPGSVKRTCLAQHPHQTPDQECRGFGGGARQWARQALFQFRERIPPSAPPKGGTPGQRARVTFESLHNPKKSMWTDSPWNPPSPSWRDLRNVQAELANAEALLRQARIDKESILREHLQERADAAGLSAQLTILKRGLSPAVLEDLRMVAQQAIREEYLAQEARAAELNAWLNR